MKHSKILSAILSCALAAAGLSSALPASYAEDAVSETTIYDSTDLEESKEADANEDAVAVDIDAPFNVFDIYNAHQEYIAERTPQIDVELEGVDISQWQGTIDWHKLKDTGIDYVILRAGYGRLASQIDTKFIENVKGAQEVGIDVGVYWYSYATTVDGAYAEAEACYEVIKDYDFTFPVYFDIEDPTQVNLSVAQLSAIVEAFCTSMQSKGYYVGVYSYSSFLNTKLYSNVLDKYDVWVAHVGVDQPSYAGDYGMWQYSFTGRVDGIPNEVDLDHCYKNYPYIISPESFVGKERLTTSSTTTSTTTTTTTTIPPKARGIDVSFWQEEIDWAAVKEAGVDFAIIRAGYGRLISQKDTRFDENVLGAKEAGIDVGVYWYSYADTPEAAVLEAEVCYEVIKDYQFEYPIYFDIEDPLIADLPPEQLSAITDAFCSTLQDKGYYVGVTSYTSFLTYKLLPYIFEKYDTWVAHYGVTVPTYKGKYGMWQYSSNGQIDGIKTRVDLNYCYREYPSVMKAYELNGFGRKIEPAEETTEDTAEETSEADISEETKQEETSEE